jgi:preprotein translocase SecE subunit
MARQTRQQRKERRQQQLADGAARGRARSATQTPVRAAAEAPAPAAEAAPRRRGHFLAESLAELQKVEWPGQRQVMQGTAVVVVACVIVGTYLFGLDQILKRFVQNVLLGQ